MPYQTRNLLDVRVGKSHSIQILFHLRQKDVPWFNDSAGAHIKQLLQLLSNDILPTECKDEIEGKKKNDGLEKQKGKKNMKKTLKGVKRKHDMNDTNTSSSSSSNKGNSKHSKNKNSKEKSMQTKGKGTNSKKKNSKDQSSTTTATSSPSSSHLSSNIFNSKNTFLFASDIQIVYKCETVQTSNSALLNYTTTHTNHVSNAEEEENGKKRKIVLDDDSETTTSSSSKRAKSKSKSKPKSTSSNRNNSNSSTSSSSNNQYSKPIKLSTFQYLKPLSKRIIIWCYPFDPNNPQELNMVNSIQSFPRPELIPISSLYCDDQS